MSVSDAFTTSNYLASGAISTIYTTGAPIVWTASQIGNFKSILDAYSQFIGISLSKIANDSGYTPAAVGASSDINTFFINRPSLSFAGVAAIPTAPFGYDGSELDIALNTAGFSDSSFADTVSAKCQGFMWVCCQIHIISPKFPHTTLIPRISPESEVRY